MHYRRRKTTEDGNSRSNVEIQIVKNDTTEIKEPADQNAAGTVYRENAHGITRTLIKLINTERELRKKNKQTSVVAAASLSRVANEFFTVL